MIEKAIVHSEMGEYDAISQMNEKIKSLQISRDDILYFEVETYMRGFCDIILYWWKQEV